MGIGSEVFCCVGGGAAVIGIEGRSTGVDGFRVARAEAGRRVGVNVFHPVKLCMRAAQNYVSFMKGGVGISFGLCGLGVEK